MAVMPYLLDVVGYLYVEQVQNDLTFETTEVRRLLTRRTNEYEAGERVGGRLSMVVDDPNIEQMIIDIFGAKPE